MLRRIFAAALLLLAVSVSAYAADGPADAVKTFYGWYVAGSDQDPRFLDKPDTAAILKRSVTDRFLKKRRAIIEQTDADPFLRAQDTLPDWATRIAVNVRNTTSDLSTMIVTLGTGATRHRLQVDAVQANGRWLLDSVTDAP